MRRVVRCHCTRVHQIYSDPIGAQTHQTARDSLTGLALIIIGSPRNEGPCILLIPKDLDAAIFDKSPETTFKATVPRIAQDTSIAVHYI
jgi:hypothetical protein